jgi:hypothetical protein
MKRLLAASLLILGLAACGGPSSEDVLTADKIKASESAPELPDIQLSENPEPPPAPPPVENLAENELDNEVDSNTVEEAGVPGNIPPAFQGLWGIAATDCRPGEVAGNAILLTGDQIISNTTVGSLQGVLADSPGTFAGRFRYEEGEQRESFTLGGGGNRLTRNGGTVYQRCLGMGASG